MADNVECTSTYTCRLSKFQSIFNYSATQKSNSVNKYSKQALMFFDIFSKKINFKVFCRFTCNCNINIALYL